MAKKLDQFEKLMLPHLQAVHAFSVSLLGESADAEDLTQETFLRAFRYFDSFQPERSPRAWLTKIAYRLYLDRMRRPRLEISLEEHLESSGDVAAAEGGPEPHYLDQHHVREALDRLPEEFRTALLLCDVQGLTYQEVAAVMGCPIGTAMSRIHRGRKLLRSLLASQSHGGVSPRDRRLKAVKPEGFGKNFRS